MNTINKLLALSGLLSSHPLVRDDKAGGALRFLKWRLLLALNKKVVFPYVNNSKLILSRDVEGVNYNCYAGLAEFEAMSFLLHFLRKEDLFIDIGAYVGAYTVLASAVIGSRTLAVEPIPRPYSRLLENLRENGIEGRVKALNIGLGSSDEILRFHSSLGMRNCVAAGGETGGDLVEVRMKRLDDVLESGSPSLIKIDVEGYVTPVLKGAERTLKKDSLKAIIAEIWKKTIPVKILLDAGFRPYSYEPFSRELSECSCSGKNDVIFLRDAESVKKRVEEAPEFRVLNRRI